MNLSITYLVYLLKNPQKLEVWNYFKGSSEFQSALAQWKFQVLGEVPDVIIEASKNSD